MTSIDRESGWEQSEFPILCEKCLGDNPYVRMAKDQFGKECKACHRPFTVFRWRPGSEARFRRTEICQTCAKVKHVCQTCLLDLEFGLTTIVRDAYRPNHEGMLMPASDINREYFAQIADKKAAEGDTPYGKFPVSNDILKLARSNPYQKRTKLCIAFVRGECKEGGKCPFRHEMPDSSDLGIPARRDEVKKNQGPLKNVAPLKPPEDTSITTLYVGGVFPDRIYESDIRDVFSPYGDIKSVRMVGKHNCAFVTYSTRASAEDAADKLNGRLIVKGLRLRLMWGNPKPDRPSEGGEGSSSSSAIPVGEDGVAALPVPVYVPPGMPALGQAYPSMNPSQLGSARGAGARASAAEKDK
eukprot:tig00021537_g22273.t1